MVTIVFAGLLGAMALHERLDPASVRRLLAGLAAAKPVVLVIDNLQWDEP